MILSVAVILGVIASVIRHRSETASQIASIPLRSPWLALIALALQVPLLRAPFGPVQQVVAAKAVFIFSHLLLLIFVWLNRRLVGIRIVGLGVVCNLLVILANGGLMPITPETLVRINSGSTLDRWTLGYHYDNSKDVILLRPDTALWVLSDILVLPPPFPWPTAFSAGDLMIAVGIVVLLQGPILRPGSVPGKDCRSQAGQRPGGSFTVHKLREEVSTNESQEP
jgi:hypothetical protein